MSTDSIKVKLSFPEWLKLRREMAKKTQADIATALNISNQAVSRWEQGNSTPALNPSQTKELCVVLGITFDELVKGFKEEAHINFS